MNCVILQPSYIPWRGFFDQIGKADCFIFYDDVQYDSRGWRNRNRIKTPHGCQWLTVPVHSSGCQTNHTPICDIRICQDTPWQAKHWRALEHSYSRAPHFETYAPHLKKVYEAHWDFLCDLTIELTIALAQELGFHHTQFRRASEFKVNGSKTDRLLELLKCAGATHYLTGPAAQAYLETEKFKRAGITLEYMSYEYPVYPQLYPPYDGHVSILDLLFMTGPDAGKYICSASAKSDDGSLDASRELEYEHS